MARDSCSDDPNYADRLARLEQIWWKRVLDVQGPYRRYLQGLKLGRVLDVGCGIGRSLINAGGGGVGVDVNPRAVELAQARGLTAFVPAEFNVSPHARPHAFDTLLLAHVVEHMPFDEAVEMAGRYLPFIKPHGQVVIIAPQEAGFASDATHVEFFDFDAIRNLLHKLGVGFVKQRSFPLPRFAGRVFPYNEFIVVGQTKPQLF